MDIFHALGRLTGQARCEVVRNVIAVGIKEIQGLQSQIKGVTPIADTQIPNRGRAGFEVTALR